MKTSAGGVRGLSVEACYALYSFYGLGRRQCRGNICVRHAFYTAAHTHKKIGQRCRFRPVGRTDECNEHKISLPQLEQQYFHSFCVVALQLLCQYLCFCTSKASNLSTCTSTLRSRTTPPPPSDFFSSASICTFVLVKQVN